MNQFGIDLKAEGGNAAYAKAYRAKYRDAKKEAERMYEWRYGRGREAYLKNKEQYRKHNKDAVNEAQRSAYARNYFRGMDVPKELIEAKHLQLLIEQELKK